MKRRWLRWLLWIALAALLALAALVAYEWTYVVRMCTYPEDEVTRAGWYRPLERVAGAPTDLPVAAAPGIAADALDQAARWAEEKRSAALVVLHRGAIVAERYAPGHGPGARTNPMSMAKTVVALLVGIALAEGALGSPDEPAARYLTAWAGDERRAITVRHLLQMASGLANDHAEDDPLTDLGYLYFGTDSPWIVGRVRAHEPPGTRFDYNSINTQALATILERATGRRYAELLSEKLWRPIGAGEAAVWLDHAGGAAKGFCCLFATARDWARVGLLVLNRGRCGDRQVVPAAWIDEMSRSSPLERDYGLHLWLGRGGARREDHREPFEADDVVWLDGRHKQRVYVVPSRELVVVRVGERARKWDEAVLVNTLVRGMRR